MIEIFGLKLEHTNGFLGGDDLDINYVLQKFSGQNYPEHILNHLKTEVKAGCYSTRDVHGWIKECGFLDVTNLEAKNICYCLLRDISVKGWKTPVTDEQGAIDNYLQNADLASEVSEGGVESIINLRIFHKV